VLSGDAKVGGSLRCGVAVVGRAKAGLKGDAHDTVEGGFARDGDGASVDDGGRRTRPRGRRSARQDRHEDHAGEDPTGEIPVGTSAQTWTNVSGARAVISVPKGTKAIIDARFDSVSYCYATSGTPTGGCFVRIMIGKAQGFPLSANDWAYVTSGVGDQQGARGMERSRGSLGPGTYTVQVQHETSDPNIYFSLHGFHLTVERIAA
jgi:hypothetical protein